MSAQRTLEQSNSMLFFSPTINFRKPAVVTKHTVVNEPESADEREQDCVADNTDDAAVMEEIPEGTCSYMDV